VETFNVPHLLCEDATQENAFEPATFMLDEIMEGGVNGTIFCYGATSSGKTYTMSGGEWGNNGIA